MNINKRYREMANIVLEVFDKNEILTKKSLFTKLNQNNKLTLFELVYNRDCYCSGEWSFFDFSDRFQRFCDALVRGGLAQKVARGAYIIL